MSSFDHHCCALIALDTVLLVLALAADLAEEVVEVEVEEEVEVEVEVPSSLSSWSILSLEGPLPMFLPAKEEAGAIILISRTAFLVHDVTK